MPSRTAIRLAPRTTASIPRPLGRFAGFASAALIVASCATQPVTSRSIAVAEPAPATSAVKAPEPVFDIPLAERQGHLGSANGSLSALEAAASYSFRSVGVPISDAIRLFARDNGLNVVMDEGLEGELTVDFAGVSLRDAMRALVEAHGYSWEQKGGLIRVYALQTRTFEVDYLRLQRGSDAESESGKFGLTEGGEGGSQNATQFNVSQTNLIDFWEELELELQDLIESEDDEGRVHANRTAGIVTVTTTARRMREVEQYLTAVHEGSLRQVNIQARIVEVELDERHRLGIEWDFPNLGKIGQYGISGGLATGASVLSSPADADITSFLFASKQGDFRALLAALATQGNLNVISQPRVTALNNQTAQIRVATDRPYFVQTQAAVVGTPGVTPDQPAEFEQRTATLGLVMQVTPHIARDGWITLEIAPVITRELGQIGFPGDPTAITGPLIIDVKQTTVVARVRSGETVILGGLMQEDVRQDTTKVPLFGDLPFVGALFRDTTDTRIQNELVVLVTPTAEYPQEATATVSW